MVYFCFLAVSSDRPPPSVFCLDTECRLPTVTEPQQFPGGESASGPGGEGSFSQEASCLLFAMGGQVFPGLLDPPAPIGGLGRPAHLLLPPGVPGWPLQGPKVQPEHLLFVGTWDSRAWTPETKLTPWFVLGGERHLYPPRLCVLNNQGSQTRRAHRASAHASLRRARRVSPGSTVSGLGSPASVPPCVSCQTTLRMIKLRIGLNAHTHECVCKTGEL